MTQASSRLSFTKNITKYNTKRTMDICRLAWYFVIVLIKANVKNFLHEKTLLSLAMVKIECKVMEREVKDMPTLGENLRAARENCDMKQEYAAAKLNVSRQSLSNWENNRTIPTIDIIIKMTELYQTDFSSLVDNSNADKPADDHWPTLLLMTGAVIVALMSYAYFQNFFVATVAGVFLPLLAIRLYRFISSQQTLDVLSVGRVYFILFKELDYEIPYAQLMKYGQIEKFTDKSVKIRSNQSKDRLKEQILQELCIADQEIEIIDPSAFVWMHP